MSSLKGSTDQGDHQGDEDISKADCLSILSTLESANKNKTNQDREVLFNLGGDPERPVCNIFWTIPLTTETDETPDPTPNNTAPTQDDQQQDETVP
eukprot:2679965-Ditylum_brightwellii.AAC.1